MTVQTFGNKLVQFNYSLCAALLLCSQIALSSESEGTVNTSDMAVEALAKSSALSIYQNSSTEIRVEQIAPLVRKNFLSMGAAASGNSLVIREKILGAMEVAYHPKKFQHQIISSLNKSLSQSEQSVVLKWLDSPIGRETSLLEAKSIIDSYIAGIPATIDEARLNRKSEKTEALLRTVNLAAMASELQLDMSINQIAASSFAANARPADLSANNYDVFFSATDSRRPKIAKVNRNYTLAMLKNAYGELSDQDLRYVISFWGSPTGSRYAFALRDGINEAFALANRDFDNDVAQIVANSAIDVAAAGE